MEYPSNSDRSKREATNERPKFEKSKGLTGDSVTKEKSIWRKVIGDFVQVDKETLKETFWKDFVEPAVKDTLLNTLSMVLYGEPRATSNLKSSLQKRTQGTKVSYRMMYENSNNHSSRTETSDGYDFKEILFKNRGDADILKKDMQDALRRYKIISILDMYDMAGRDDAPHTYADYGWTDIGDPKIIPVNGYYVIDLPRPLPIK